MNGLFPNRSRRDLKLKFKKEEKTNAFLINKALIEHGTFDVDELKETFRKEDERREEERQELQRTKERAMAEKAEQKRKQRVSRGQRACDDQNMDLEEVPLAQLRTYKPRRPKKKKVAEEVPNSPFSVPPASPCKTPAWPSSPQKPSDAYYYDLNLQCTTRGQRRLTESEASAVVEIVPPKSVEMFLDENEEDERRLFRPMVMKQEDDVDLDDLDLSNLVVVEIINEINEKTFKVYLMDSETNEMSEEPLDLPPEVIEYIVEAHQKQNVE